MTPEDIGVGIAKAGEAVSTSLVSVRAAAGDQAAISAANIMTRLALAFVLENIGPRCALR